MTIGASGHAAAPLACYLLGMLLRTHLERACLATLLCFTAACGQGTVEVESGISVGALEGAPCPHPQEVWSEAKLEEGSIELLRRAPRLGATHACWYRVTPAEAEPEALQALCAEAPKVSFVETRREFLRKRMDLYGRLRLELHVDEMPVHAQDPGVLSASWTCVEGTSLRVEVRAVDSPCAQVPSFLSNDDEVELFYEEGLAPIDACQYVHTREVKSGGFGTLPGGTLGPR